MELGLFHHAPVANRRALDHRVENFARGQETGLGVNRRRAVVEAELRVRVVALQVGVEERVDGTNILPVSFKQVRLHLQPLGGGLRDDFAAKIVGLREVIHQEHLHRLGGEDVDTHGCNVRHFLSLLRIEA